MSSPPSRPLSRRAVLPLFFVLLLVYNANGRLIAAGDSIPARLIPFAILNHGTVFLDAYGPSPPSNYWFRPARNGRLASIYPIVLPLLVAPLFVPAAVYVQAAQPSPRRFETLCELMEKLSASLIAALSGVVMLLLLRRLTSERKALLLALAYALGTETWSIASQALWLHGMAELLLAAALLLRTLRQTAGSAIALGALCSLMAFNRPPNALFALVLAATYALDHRKRLLPFAIGAIVAGLPFLAYNLEVFGNVAGGYGILAGRRLLQHADPIAVGAAALLFSPGKGLFVYSPFLLFAVRSRVPGRRKMAGIPLLPLWIAFAGLVLIYSLADWTAGACYGPRFLTDASPFLVVALVPALDKLRSRPARLAFGLSLAFAILVQAIGAFYFPQGGSHALSHREYWRPSGAQFYWEARAGPAPPLLFQKIREWLGESR